MYNDAKNFSQVDFGLTPEQLEQGELRYSIYGIYELLTSEQLALVEANDVIMAKHLTPAQLQKAQEVKLEDGYFTERFSLISHQTVVQVEQIAATN